MRSRASVWNRFKKNKIAVIVLTFVVCVTLLSVLAPVISPYSYSEMDMTIAKQAPSATHLLGTDEYGRDILTRLLYGGQASMSIALAATGLQVVIGVVLGLLAGYFRGWVDVLVMRITDMFMCFPFFILAICFAAVVGPGLGNLIFIIGLLSWMGICRIVRAEVLSVRERDYILAARALGLSSWQIIVKHILPNIISPVLVFATMSVAGNIIAEASMSFLNLGVQLPKPSWGNMLAAAQNMEALLYQWWRWLPPGFMIIAVVMSMNYIGETLRKAIDPETSGEIK